MPSDPDHCLQCGHGVLIPGLDQSLCSSCGWQLTQWGKQEELRQAERRRRQAEQRRLAKRHL